MGMKLYTIRKTVMATPMTASEYRRLRGWEPSDSKEVDMAGYLIEDTPGARPANMNTFRGYISWMSAESFGSSASPIVDSPSGQTKKHMGGPTCIKVELEEATFWVAFLYEEGQKQRISDWDGGTPEIAPSVNILGVWNPQPPEIEYSLQDNLLEYLSANTIEQLEEAAYKHMRD